MKLAIHGDIALQREGHEPLTARLFQLLEAVRDQGSIVQAAKTVGVSYKTAWDLLNRANNLADQPMVVRNAGGNGGGCSALTEAGHQFVRQYRLVQEEQRQYLNRLARQIGDPDRIIAFLRRIAMRLSARNVLAGTIAEIRKGAVNAEVILAISEHDRIAAIITNESVDDLGLKAGAPAYAIIKASAILIGFDVQPARLSARNFLTGVLTKLEHGLVNSEATITLPGGRTLTATITRVSAERLGLQESAAVAAVFKASSVIIGLD